MKKHFLILVFFISYVATINAQIFDKLTNPQVQIAVTHPPGLGIKVNKIAFNNPTTDCGSQIVDAMISDFVANQVEVIDRENLDAIIAEHNLKYSGYIDKNTAVEIGKILGPSALVTVKVNRCQTEIKDRLTDMRRYRDNEGNYYTRKVFISRTRVYLKGSIQTVDLTTGRIFTAQVFEYSPFLQYESLTGWPEVPSKYDVQKLAFDSLAVKVHKMFFSWSQNVTLFFFDDKDGGLKEAFNALKVGDIPRALDLSKSNLQQCKNSNEIKDKILSHAYYNLGMMYFITREYDSAIYNFQEANRINSGSIITNAITECNRAKALAEEMQRVDEKATIEIENKETKQLEAVNVLTNADILSLTKNKLPTTLIIQKIN